AAVYIDLRIDARFVLSDRLRVQRLRGLDLRSRGIDAGVGGNRLQIRSANREHNEIAVIERGRSGSRGQIFCGTIVSERGEIDNALACQHAGVEPVKRSENAPELKAGWKVLRALESKRCQADFFIGGDDGAAHIRKQPRERTTLCRSRTAFRIRGADDPKVVGDPSPNRFVQVQRQWLRRRETSWRAAAKHTLNRHRAVERVAA